MTSIKHFCCVSSVTLEMTNYFSLFILGEFANHLPDYQKIEIMVFVMGKVQLPSESSHR